MSELWPWLAVFGLGMFHGINPAMGWLFAVALGLQEQKRAAVFRALPPMVLGHALSIGIIIAAVLLARVSLPHRTLKIVAAAILFAFGLYRLCVRVIRTGGDASRLRRSDALVFIMASAHGAGLMLVPFFSIAALNPPGSKLNDALLVVDVDSKSSNVRSAGRRGEIAKFWRRAASLWLERVQLGALPVCAASARRTALPGRAGYPLVTYSHHRYEARPAETTDRQSHRAGGSFRAHQLFASAHDSLRSGSDLR